MDDFRPAPRLRFFGDAGQLAPLRNLALRELGNMNRENAFDLAVYGRTVTLPSGERIECRRIGDQDCLDLHAAPPPERADTVLAGRGRPRAPEGAFYAIPDCLARYEGLTGIENAIPDGDLAGWSLGLGKAVSVVRRADVGLPEAQGLPEADLDREVGVFRMPGGSASGILFGREHIPDNAPFSVSCLMRLNAPLAYDYTYDERAVLNPFRTYFLRSDDGETFTWDCPGDIAPILGFCSPHPHPDWHETVTYPWAPWNADFTRDNERLSGTRRLSASPCPDAPLLAGDGYRDTLGRDYPHPFGFILGLQTAGLFLYGGNRLLGARISHFETQTGYSPVLTDALDLGAWYHVVFTHAATGEARIYLARENRGDAWFFAGNQPLCAMDAACEYTCCGVNAWPLHNGLTGTDIGAYRMAPALDMALPRFFHHALSASQAHLLQREALDGLFVADDHETAQAVARGLTPIIIEREDA